MKRLKILMCINMVHIFFIQSNRKVWEFVNSLVEFNRYTNSPVANYHGEIYNMPFNMNTFSKMWDDVRTPVEAKARIAEQKAKSQASLRILKNRQLVLWEKIFIRNW